MDNYDRAYRHIKFLEKLLRIAVYAPSFIWGRNTSDYIMLKIKYNIYETISKSIKED